ncbi:hypothetical protein EKO27_g4602, partial [Xylaria grammica]
VAAGTGNGQVVAIAVHTVVPVLAHNTSSSANASLTSPSVPSISVPVVAAGTSRPVGFVGTLGYGLVLWFVVFWIGIVL